MVSNILLSLPFLGYLNVFRNSDAFVVKRMTKRLVKNILARIINGSIFRQATNENSNTSKMSQDKKVTLETKPWAYSRIRHTHIFYYEK
mmetsp:Transcript_65660/g.97257  ORF Transcript_65660/g.97257 Transcript_65660/m.97257 type:complete len:89 (+) Transcript_65660:1089-1355(+)